MKVNRFHRILRAIYFAIVYKFVENKIWWSRAGGVTIPKSPLDPRLSKNVWLTSPKA
jgi:hypothetical protein